MLTRQEHVSAVKAALPTARGRSHRVAAETGARIRLYPISTSQGTVIVVGNNYCSRVLVVTCNSMRLGDCSKKCVV